MSIGGVMLRVRSTLVACALAFCLALAADMSVRGASAAELTFELSIEHGRLSKGGRTIQVKQGDVVKLRFTSDQRLTLHLHGYDLEKRVEPGAVSELSFKAYATGRFPLHVHGPSDRGAHAQEEPPLANVEVYPR